MVHKLSRPVSIIGTSTLGQHYYDEPELQGLSIYELWAHACHQAMSDAGVKPKDIDKIVYSHMAYFVTCGNILAPVGSLEEWIGCREKPIAHIEQACASGYVSFMEACNAVASGRYDCVLVAGVETPKHFIPRDQPAYRVKPLKDYDGWWHPGRALFDTAYYRWDGVSDNLLTDENAYFLKQNYGTSDQIIDDAYNAMAVNLSRGAARNERAVERKEYAQIAKEKGFDDVMEYMRSSYNPHITQYIRKSGSVLHNVAAGAIIVCSEDFAKKVGAKKPINVVDYASSSNTERYPWCFHQMNVDVRDQLLANGTDTSDVDLMITTVMTSGEQMDSTEVFGYLPAGKGCEYEIEGRTAFDGDRPVNPHGGDIRFGHSFAVAGISMLSEAILQMRGEAGGCQVMNKVNRCLVRGMGGGHTTAGIVLESKF